MYSQPPPPQQPMRAALYLDYAGRRYPVMVARFIIGRERGACHLVLPDNNVSRQHAAVEFHHGVPYMIDLGSRNGVGYNGHRIARKRIVEGDRFEIGAHVLSFTFHQG